jgi:tetraacyldisaccharide 4'-kinase
MPDIRLALQQAWLTKGLVNYLLWPVSLIYGLLVGFRKLLYRIHVFRAQQLPVPVIVVGNVFVGGVGKTPLVIALVKQLTARGLQVGVLSRGYGRSGEGTQSVTPHSLVSDVGDEPLLIARACQVPVFVGKDRFQAGRDLLAQNPKIQVIVCDDGLQHLGLAHDVALCVFDERGLGNGWVLPAGPLREFWPVHAVGHSRLITVSTSSQATQYLQTDLLQTDFQVPRVLGAQAHQADGTTQALSSFRDQKVQALAGIGKPQAFFDMLSELGITPSATHALADHDDMRAVNIDPAMGAVLCTEKDAVKLWNHLPTAWAVPVVTEIPQDLLDAILAPIGPKLSSVHGHQTT